MPGVLSAINTQLSKHEINILAQYLKTNEEIGYVVLDVDKKLSAPCFPIVEGDQGNDQSQVVVLEGFFMENENIKNLQEALSLSPENIPLRLHLAELLFQEKMISEAAEQFRETLNRNYGNTRAQLGLAACYFHQKKYSAAVIVYEQIQQELPVNAMLIYIRCLIKENSLQHAGELYQKLLCNLPVSEMKK